MPISNYILCLKGIDFFYKFTDSQRIWNIPSPGNDCTCWNFRIQSSLNQQILSPIFCSAFDWNRISQSMSCHNTGIRSKVADKSNMKLIKILTKPVGKFALHVSSFGNEWYYWRINIVLCLENTGFVWIYFWGIIYYQWLLHLFPRQYTRSILWI